jgi:hypothetical protein
LCGVRWLTVRGELGASPVMYLSTLTESIGGRPAAAAAWSVGSAPATSAKVAYLCRRIQLAWVGFGVRISPRLRFT